jgi:hypothetical protein
VIWFLSTESFSWPNTSPIISAFLRWLLPSVSLAAIQLLHVVIRKSVHFTEFFVFSLLLLDGIRESAAGGRWAGPSGR